MRRSTAHTRGAPSLRPRSALSPVVRWRALAHPRLDRPRCSPRAEPLPEGWEERESSQYAGRKYYFNPTTNETTWERPKPDPGAGLDPNVIARIEIVYNPKFGKYDAQKLCAQLLAVGSDKQSAVGVAGMIMKDGKAVIKGPMNQAARLVKPLCSIPALNVTCTPPIPGSGMPGAPPAPS